MISFRNDQYFLITGASSGFGAACATLLNSLGATVVATGRNAERLQLVQEKCTHPDRFFAETRDLTENTDDIPLWIRSLKDKYARFSGLICCAGLVSLMPAGSQKLEDMHQLFDVNVFALYQTMRGFLDKRCHVSQGASAVLLASSGAWRENAGISAYAASKGAVISIMRSLATEYLPQKIRINSISPGFVETPMTQGLYKDAAERASDYPLRAGTPQDIANLAVFLLSEAAGWITGQNILIDGGRSVQ